MKTKSEARGVKSAKRKPRHAKQNKISTDLCKQIIAEAAAGMPKMQPDIIEQSLEAIRMSFFKDFKAVKGIIGFCNLALVLCKTESDKARVQQCLDHCEHWLADVHDLADGNARQRARHSGNPYFLSMETARSEIGMEELPGLLERLSESEWDNPASSDCLGFGILEALTGVIRFVQKDAEEHPERYRLWAREQPYFPMMVFRNPSAYRRSFDKIAEGVQLGAICPINSASNAQYHFDVPVNVLVFATLCEFQRVFAFLSEYINTPIESRRFETPEKMLMEDAEVSPKAVNIFLDAHRLPTLRKDKVNKYANPKMWAKVALVPFLEAEYPDWSVAPGLKDYVIKAKAGGRAKAKEAITKALIALARPHPATE